MKTRITYVLVLLLIAFCVNAQESKYFDMNIRKHRTSFQPKDAVEPKPKNNNYYAEFHVDYKDDYFKHAAAIFKEVFKDPEATPEKFDRIHFFFSFDSDYRIVYYIFLYPTERLSEFPKMEEDLARFAQLIMEKFDPRPYVEVSGPFEYGPIQINLGALTQYLKNPEYAKSYR